MNKWFKKEGRLCQGDSVNYNLQLLQEAYKTQVVLCKYNEFIPDVDYTLEVWVNLDVGINIIVIYRSSFESNWEVNVKDIPIKDNIEA